MPTLNVHEAKTNFSRLLELVHAGEEVVIARAGVPVARLVPYASPARRRAPPGSLAETGWRLPDDFDEPVDALFDALAPAP